MRTGNAFYDNLPKEEKRDFGSLFLDNFDADAQDAEEKIDDFLKYLKEFIAKQLKIDSGQLDLRKIYFLGDFSFNKTLINNKDVKILFDRARFRKQANFINTTLKEASFQSCVFEDKAIFENTIFSNGVDFQHTFFEADAIFRKCPFNKEGIANFFDVTFKEDATFVDSKFNSAVFRKTKFLNRAIFNRSYFSNIADFSEMIFVNLANFRFATFEGDTIFTDSIFCNEADFCEIHFGNNAYLNMENISFNEINLKGTYFESPLLLQLKAYKSDDKIKNYIHDNPTQEQEKKLKEYVKSQQAPLDAQHFANKESVRLIKDHFEKQNNITEANKYFRIEQKKYIEELENEGTKERNKIGTLASLYLNKVVSDFGTSWVRAILFLILWGFSVYAISGLIQCIQGQADCIGNALNSSTLSYLFAFSRNSTHINDLLGFSVLLVGIYIIYRATYYDTNHSIKKRIFYIGLFIIWLLITTLSFHQYKTLNEVAKILNPLNMFGKNSIFDGHEALVLFVKAVTLAIIYQIIVAFRQNTRRK